MGGGGSHSRWLILWYRLKEACETVPDIIEDTTYNLFHNEKVKEKNLIKFCQACQECYVKFFLMAIGGLPCSVLMALFCFIFCPTKQINKLAQQSPHSSLPLFFICITLPEMCYYVRV